MLHVLRDRDVGRHSQVTAPPADFGKISNFFNFLQNFATFWRARSRLYQNEILQETMRLTAFFKLYKICMLLPRCNLKISAKNRFEKSDKISNLREIFKIEQNCC